MAIRLDRLLPFDQLLNKDGTPSHRFVAIWQSFAENIENAVNGIVDVLIRLGLVEVTAEGALELAESAIEPGGTIKEEKVATSSIEQDGVTGRYFAQNVSSVTLTDGVEVEIIALSVTKLFAESDIDLDPCVRFVSTDDVRGTLNLYRDTTMIDSFNPFMNGSGGTFRTALSLPFTDSGQPAGTYTYRVKFQRSGGASAVTAAEGSCLRAKEFKR